MEISGINPNLGGNDSTGHTSDGAFEYILDFIYDWMDFMLHGLGWFIDVGAERSISPTMKSRILEAILFVLILFFLTTASIFM